MMTRDYQNKDYEMIESWWKAWGFPIIQRELLPKEGLITDDKVAVFIYETVNTPIAWLAWMVSDPVTTKIERDVVIKELIAESVKRAGELHYTRVFMTTDSAQMAERLVSEGFVSGDLNVQQFFKVVEN